MRLIQIAALAAVGLGCRLNAHAQLNAWPHDLPAAHSWFMCSSLNGEPMVAWVSEKKAVVAVSSLQGTSKNPIPSTDTAPANATITR